MSREEELEKEVAALRQECDYWREYMPRVANENERARALLARCADVVGRSKPEDAACVCHLRMGGCFPHDAEDVLRAVRAFLDPRRADEYIPGEGAISSLPQKNVVRARDEARRAADGEKFLEWLGEPRVSVDELIAERDEARGAPEFSCIRCGKAMSKAEGGSVFMYCEACWNARAGRGGA